MGAETICTARFKGKTASGKCRLETEVLQFRGGDLRLSIPFKQMSKVTARDGTLNVTFPGLEGESLLMNLDLEGVCASSGSACMVGSVLPSHVLLAMGVPPENAKSTVRFSLGHGTTENEIEETIGAVTRTVSRMSPH